MSDDSSNYSSEDEAESSPPAVVLEDRVIRENTYKCPEDFVRFTHKPCSSTLTSSLTHGNTELWLIKAPASFNPQRFHGVSVPLSGLQTVRVASADDAAPASGGDGNGSSGGGRQCIYSVLGSGRHRPTAADLRLLTSAGPASDWAVCGPAFCGMLSVGEVHGDVGDDALRRPLHTIPAPPPPAVPPGLKQRFLPFGSKTPTLTCVAESELDAGAAGPSSTTLRPLVVKNFPAEVGMMMMEEEEMPAGMTEEERRKERKRRRRLKRIKTEQQDPGLGEEVEQQQLEENPGTTVVKLEPIRMSFHQEEEEEDRRRKRKRRKKDKEKGQVLEEAQVGEVGVVEVEGYHQVKMEMEVMVKHEPVDVAYEEAGSARKKKKKKSKMDEA